MHHVVILLEIIGSPSLNQSPTTLKDFDGRDFKPYGILNLLVVEIGGKPILVEVEVVDVPLDYNLLLGCSWFYTMTIVSSSVFHLLQFPHQGKIVTIDQLDYCIPHTTPSTTNNVPLVGDSKVMYDSVGVSLLKDSTLMGTFPLPSPNLTDPISLINMISSMACPNPSDI
jgi:hypothetical protein